MSNQAADMVHHAGRVREGARELGQLGVLRVIDHRVERKPARRQRRKARAESAILHQSARGLVAAGIQLFVGVPLGDEADAAEAPAAGCDLGIEHRRHFGA